MKHKPQSLPSRTAALVLAVSAAGLVVCQITPVSLRAQDAADAAASEAAKGDATAAPALQKSDLSATQVFDAIAAKLDGTESLSCDLHQTILMSSHRFDASGRYLQASGNRMRLEYQIYPVRAVTSSDARHLEPEPEPEDTAERKATGSLRQVSDGSVLWSYWINGTQKQLTRRNISEILDATSDVPNYSAATSLQDLGVGGMQALMSQLQVGMDFGVVQEQQISSKKLLVLSGRWNKKTRTELFQIPDDADTQLPEYIPDYVRIYVDAESMLPRRIQYLKKHPDPEQKQIRPLVTLDLRNLVLNAPVDDGVFEFQRPDEPDLEEIDLTSQVIDGIKRTAAAKDSEDAAATEPTPSADPETSKPTAPAP
ncbi:MAG: hypothetical protein RIK87_30210 [Fuerstiella sp.]